VRKFLRDNGLSVTMLALFLVFIVGQSLTGLRQYNEQQRDHGRPEIGLGTYWGTGDFVEATFENWESEFLQMGLYVLLTAFLYQKGSSESNPLPGEKRKSPARIGPDSPAPLHRGGWLLRIYSHSLSGVLLLLFLVSFFLHAAGGTAKYNHEQELRGAAGISMLEYLGSSRFWFESFQNWQSEFLSVGAIVLLSVVLREKGSSQSKDLAAPHAATGD